MRNAPTVLAATVLTIALLARGPAVSAQQASEAGVAPILRAASSALGVRNLKSLPAFHATATGTAVGLPAELESYTDLSAGGAFASYLRVGGFRQDSGFDGRSAWTRDDAGVVWVDGSQQGHAAAVNEAYRESYALWTPSRAGAAVALLTPQSDGGRSYDVVRVTPPGSAVPFEVWIDRATHLPARYVETAGAITTTTLLSDYRSVAGVKLPFAADQTSSQGNETKLQVTRVEVASAGVAAKVRKPESSAHDFSIAGGSETSVPFDLIDNHVYLNVSLDGKGPYRFIFDTGGQNVVDPAVAREIGAVSAGNAQGGGVGSTTETFSFAPVAALRVGAAELRNQLFAVLPIRAGFGIGGSAPVDGLIGAEVLARFVTVFDYEHKRVTFKLPGAAAAGTRVPFVFSGTQPEVPCAIDGIASRCTIDSGSRSSLDLFSPFLAEHPSVVPAGATAAGLNGFGIGGGEIGRLGRLPSLAIGGFELKNLVAGLSGATSGAFAVPGIAANIGGSVLKRFTVTYDYAHETMSLEPNASFAEPDPYERSGMFLINKGGVLVVDVRPGTPAAEAGIAKGDAIESIDGEPAEKLTLGGVREAFRRPSGTQLELQIRSKGASSSHKVLLTLRDYV